MPLLLGLPADQPWHKLDQSAHGWASVAWVRGVAAGARYEALRRELLGPVMTCPRCDGIGVVWGGTRGYLDGKERGERETCPECKGAGTVPTPVTTVALAGD